MGDKRYKKIPLRPARHLHRELDEEGVPLSFEVGLHPYAYRDRRDNLRYIAEQSEHNMHLVEQRISDALLSLKIAPHTAGRNGRAAGTRELFVPKTRLIIAFVVRPGVGVVVAVRLMHYRQIWPKPELERLAIAKYLSVVEFVG